MSLSVSVVIPTHDRARFIRRAVGSVLSQLREDDELVVVDDDSRDDTGAVLASLRDRIVYVKTARGGAGGARNEGIARARNPLVAFLDSDDEWLPGKLGLQRGLMESRPELVLCWSDLRVDADDGTRRVRVCRYEPAGDRFLSAPKPYSTLSPLPAGSADFAVRVGDLYPWVIHAESVQVGTLMYRRALAPEIRFPTDLAYAEDQEFVALLARRGPAAYLETVTEAVHWHGSAQLIKQDSVTKCRAKLTSFERVWGEDEAYLRERREEFEQAVEAVRTKLVRSLLAAGRGEEARAEAALLRSPSALVGVLSRLPPFILVNALAFRRAARRALGLPG